MKSAFFMIPGEPKGKERPRFGKGCTYTPKKTRDYEKLIRTLFLSKNRGVFFDKGIPLKVSISAHFSIPKSYTKKQRKDIGDNKLRPTKKPDLDNICKAVCDALNGTAYHDDSQIVHVDVSKHYSETAGVFVRISGEV